MDARFVHTIGWCKEKWGTPAARRVFLVFAVVCLVSILWVGVTHAQTLEAATNMLTSLIATFFFAIASLLVGVMGWAISALITVASYNNYIHEPGVLVGWTLARDVANLFFVVILLTIAFGTILGLEQYHLKKTLPRFVVTAVLINFSRLILGVLIDVSQVITMTFVNAIKQVGGGNILQAFNINEAFRIAQIAETDVISPMSTLITGIFVSFLLFMATVLIGMFAILMVLRLAMLWILVVLAPIAFLLGTIPAGDFKEYYMDWWGKLKGNVILGPALAFFLWLALAMVGDGNIYARVTAGGGGVDGSEATQALGGRGKGITNSNLTTMQNLIGFAIAAGIFGATFQMAKDLSQKASLPGGSMVTGAAGGLVKGAVKKFSGYNAAKRASAPVLQARREKIEASGMGAGAGQKIKRGYLAAAAIAPGNQEAKDHSREKLMEARMSQVTKHQKRMDHMSNDDLQKMSDSTDSKGQAAALELASRGESFAPEKANMLRNAFAGNDKASKELNNHFKKTSPELAYDTSNDKEVDAMLNDKNVNLDSLGAAGVNPKLLQKMHAKMGDKGFGKQVSNFKDPRVQKMAQDMMRDELIPGALTDQRANLGKLANVSSDLGKAESALAKAKSGGAMTFNRQQKVLDAERDVTKLSTQKQELEVKVKAADGLVNAHVAESKNPVDAVKGVGDDRQRRSLMRKGLDNIKPADIDSRAFADKDHGSEMLTLMQDKYGSQFNAALKKLDPGQRKEAEGAAKRIKIDSDSVKDAHGQKEAQVKLKMTGDFSEAGALPSAANPKALTPPIRKKIVSESVGSMNSADLAKVKTGTLGAAESDFYAALAKNLPALRGLNKADGISTAKLAEIERKIESLARSQGGDYLNAKEEIKSWNL